MRLTICGETFDLPEAFQEGHSCTFAEAQFLEAERGRRIQDLLARRGASLTQAEVEAFAVTWKFEPRAAAAARLQEVEAQLAAAAEIQAAASGLVEGTDEWWAFVAAKVADPEARALAHRLVDERRRLVAQQINQL